MSIDYQDDRSVSYEKTPEQAFVATHSVTYVHTSNKLNVLIRLFNSPYAKVAGRVDGRGSVTVTSERRPWH